MTVIDMQCAEVPASPSSGPRRAALLYDRALVRCILSLVLRMRWVGGRGEWMAAWKGN